LRPATAKRHPSENTMRILNIACCVSAILAILTNRWVATSGQTPAFSVVSFKSLWFQCQWLGFLLSAGAMGACLVHWYSTGRFPRLTIAACALALFYLFTGVLTTDADQWASGASSLPGRWHARHQDIASRNLRTRFEADWQSPAGLWTIRADSLALPGCDAAHITGVSTGTSAELITPEIAARFANQLGSLPVELPVLEVSCSDRLLVLALISETRILAIPWPKGEPQLLTRPAR